MDLNANKYSLSKQPINKKKHENNNKSLLKEYIGKTYFGLLMILFQGYNLPKKRNKKRNKDNVKVNRIRSQENEKFKTLQLNLTSGFGFHLVVQLGIHHLQPVSGRYCICKSGSAAFKDKNLTFAFTLH